MTELQRLLQVRRVTRAYYTADCTSLGGLEHVLGFHFDDDRLARLEFFLETEHDPTHQFPIWQRHLEATFGPPTATADGEAGFPTHHWTVSGAKVHHAVVERFGLEEHVGITRPAT